MGQINAYLLFDGNCREAMNFYKGCFGGELSLTTIGESPVAKDLPADKQNRIMHARLQSDGALIMAADGMGPGGTTPGGNISLSFTGRSQKEIDTVFGKLSAGGKVLHSPKDEFFGYYGDLKDKYGINWMLVYEKPRS
jgi:PhnB protein